MSGTENNNGNGYDDIDLRIVAARISARQAAMDSEFRDLRHMVVNLGDKIDAFATSINSKIEQRSQPQWQTYISGAILLGGLFFAFITPIQNNQHELATSLHEVDTEHRTIDRSIRDDLNKRMDTLITRNEFREFRSTVNAQLSEIRTNLYHVDQPLQRPKP